MKIHIHSLLPGLCLLLLGLTLGFYLGRDMGSGSIDTKILPAEPQHNAVAEAALPEDSGAYGVTFPVNINTAGVYELTALPGIGETLAVRILTYRDARGPFPNPEALLNVDGIGPGILESILPQITTGG